MLNQTMQDLLPGILYSFAALFIILDPLLSVPIFAAMTKGQTTAEIHKQAFIAVTVAGGLMYIFLVFNTAIFAILGLSVPAFQIAGGIILFLLGLQEALGIESGVPRRMQPQQPVWSSGHRSSAGQARSRR